MPHLRARTALVLALGSVTALAAGACGDDTSTTSTSTGTGAGGNGGSTGTGGAGGGATGVQIPGLSAPVSAVYDSDGILHLSCKTDDDCYAALGYFHASNRFFFMDFIRNLIRGRLANLVKAGDVVLEKDYANRQWFSTPEGEPLETKLYQDASPEVRGHLDAFTRGVNAWIGDMRAGKNGATLTTEYDFALIVKGNIRDWEPEDSAAIGLYVLDDLSNNSDSELALGEKLPAYDPTLAADLFSVRPVFDAFTLPASGQPAPVGVLPLGDTYAGYAPMFAEAGARMARVGAGAAARNPGDNGSNDWVVGPGRTTAGNALLANDPHLPLTNPSIWFPVEIDAVTNGTGAYHTAGSTFPGLPATMIGMNEDVAWGVTTANWDLADVYVETVSDDGTTVKFNGTDVPVVEKEFTFDDAKSGTQVKKTFRWVPHHGPIVSEDPTTNSAITIRWRGHDGGTDLDAFFAVAKAKTIAEAKQGIELVSSASQNFVVIDSAGGIGWYPFSKVPSRPWASAALVPWLPLPGDGTAEWGPPVPSTALPQATNPTNGVIATANADMTGASADGDLLNDGQAALQAFDMAEGTRVQRILDRLESGGNAHSVATMHDIQGDDYSLYGEVVVPAILLAATGQTLNADEQNVIDALTAWDHACPTGLSGTDPVTAPDSTDAAEAAASIGCTAFHAMLFAIVREAIDDENAAAMTTASGWDLKLVVRALKDPSSIGSGDLLWDDVSTVAVETRDDIILRALSRAAAQLAVTGEPNKWRWGRLHTITLRSIYDQFSVPTYNDGPYAAAGGQYTVNVANPRSRALPSGTTPWDFAFANGPSVRFVVEATPEGLQMTYELPGGSDLHRASPFYNNLLPGWLSNTPIEFRVGPAALTNPAKTVEVNPG